MNSLHKSYNLRKTPIRKTRQTPLRHCRFAIPSLPAPTGNLSVIADPDRQSSPHGSEVGSSGHEVVGAPDAVPPLAPTMSLIPRGHRTLRSYTLIPPVERHTSCRHSRRARTGRPGYSLNPTPSKAPPTPLPSPWRLCDNTLRMTRELFNKPVLNSPNSHNRIIIIELLIYIPSTIFAIFENQTLIVFDDEWKTVDS